MNKERINKREIMFNMIRKWRESGVSQASFCEEHQIALSTFAYRMIKFRKQERETSVQQETRSSGKFIAININQGSDSEYGFSVLYPNGVQLHFSTVVDADQLQRLVHLF